MKCKKLTHKLRRIYCVVRLALRSFWNCISYRGYILLPVFERCVSSRCSLLDSRIWLYTKKGWIVRLNILPPIVKFDCKRCWLKDCLKKQVQQK